MDKLPNIDPGDRAVLDSQPNKVYNLVCLARGSSADEWTCAPGVLDALYQVSEMVDDWLAWKGSRP